MLRKIGKNYSKDEAKILREMLRRGKEVAQNAVDYIVNNDVHIILDKHMYSGVGALWRDGNIYINSTQGNDNFNSLGDLANSGYYSHLVGVVAHEAKHLEQGGMTANTVFGEFEGWKTELEVKGEMFQQVPRYGTARDMILRTPLSHDPDVLGMVWRGMVADQGFDYGVWILPLDSDGMYPAIFAPH
jgi:hypothetical protein